MIISNVYKFIFLKTKKTAGTSIEIALSKYCGPDDVITPISGKDEEIRKQLGYPGPQNYLAPIWEYNVQDMAILLRHGKKRKRYYNHIPANEIKTIIGEKIWNSYYKFCFVRNPWDRIISLYYWRHKRKPRPTISEFIASQVPLALKYGGYDIYTIDGKVVVDKVCRYENINEELESIRIQLGIPDKLELPRAKSNFRNDKRNYREVLSENDRNKIEELFSNEIALFGYKF